MSLARRTLWGGLHDLSPLKEEMGPREAKRSSALSCLKLGILADSCVSQAVKTTKIMNVHNYLSRVVGGGEEGVGERQREGKKKRVTEKGSIRRRSRLIRKEYDY